MKNATSFISQYFPPSPDYPPDRRGQEVPCGTSGGVMIYFDRVKVVNILDPSKGD